MLPDVHNIAPTPSFGLANTLLAESDFVVLDTETTGVDPLIDKIVEIGMVRVINGVRQPVFQSFVNPGICIPCTATAIHGITDAMVAEAPTLDQLAPAIREYVGSATIVAHHALFDRGFVNEPVFLEDGTPPPTYHQMTYEGAEPKGGMPWICTMRLAQHVFAQAPGFSNQVLRYWLKTNPEQTGVGAHRAIDDVLVTLEVFKTILHALSDKVASLEDVLRLSESPVAKLIMPRGKHVDKPMSEVPTDYLEWMLRKDGMSDMDRDLGLAVLAEYELRQNGGRPEPVVELQPLDSYSMPFGNSKGKTLLSCSDSELVGMCNWIKSKGADRFAEHARAAGEILAQRLSKLQAKD